MTGQTLFNFAENTDCFFITHGLLENEYICYGKFPSNKKHYPKIRFNEKNEALNFLVRTYRLNQEDAQANIKRAESFKDCLIVCYTHPYTIF